MAKNDNLVGRDVAQQNTEQAVAMAHLMVARTLRGLLVRCVYPDDLRRELRDFIDLLESQEVPS